MDIDDIPNEQVDYSLMPDYAPQQHVYKTDGKRVFSNAIFDEASREWRANKVKRKGRYWQYRCAFAGCRCQATKDSSYCKRHVISQENTTPNPS